MRAILTAIWQADTAFPTGSFAFSNGIEGAVTLGGELDRKRLSELLEAVLRHRWATAERPAMLAAFRASGDLAAVTALDALYDASTLAEPLRIGSRRTGAAFLTTHARIGTPGATILRAENLGGRTPGHLPIAQGFVWQCCGIDEAGAVAASGYTTASGLVNAAVRLGCIGAVEAQAVLAGALSTIAELASASARCEPDKEPTIASTTSWLDIAAVRHTRADVRLFAN